MNNHAHTILMIGCCGAFCGTCRERRAGVCRGCRSGYDTGERDIARSKCPMKVCCFGRWGTTRICANCPVFEECSIIRNFFGKNGYKYRKYRDSSNYIRCHGAESFVNIARTWSAAYGKLPARPPTNENAGSIAP